MPVQEEMYFFAGAKGMGKHQPIEAKLRTFQNVQFFFCKFVKAFRHEIDMKRLFKIRIASILWYIWHAFLIMMRKCSIGWGGLPLYVEGADFVF